MPPLGGLSGAGKKDQPPRMSQKTEFGLSEEKLANQLASQQMITQVKEKGGRCPFTSLGYPSLPALNVGIPKHARILAVKEIIQLKNGQRIRRDVVPEKVCEWLTGI